MLEEKSQLINSSTPEQLWKGCQTIQSEGDVSCSIAERSENKKYGIMGSSTFGRSIRKYRKDKDNNNNANNYNSNSNTVNINLNARNNNNNNDSSSEEEDELSYISFYKSPEKNVEITSEIPSLNSGTAVAATEISALRRSSIRRTTQHKKKDENRALQQSSIIKSCIRQLKYFSSSYLLRTINASHLSVIADQSLGDSSLLHLVSDMNKQNKLLKTINNQVDSGKKQGFLEQNEQLNQINKNLPVGSKIQPLLNLGDKKTDKVQKQKHLRKIFIPGTKTNNPDQLKQKSPIIAATQTQTAAAGPVVNETSNNLPDLQAQALRQSEEEKIQKSLKLSSFHEIELQRKSSPSNTINLPIQQATQWKYKIYVSILSGYSDCIAKISSCLTIIISIILSCTQLFLEFLKRIIGNDPECLSQQLRKGFEVISIIPYIFYIPLWLSFDVEIPYISTIALSAGVWGTLSQMMSAYYEKDTLIVDINKTVKRYLRQHLLIDILFYFSFFSSQVYCSLLAFVKVPSLFSSAKSLLFHFKFIRQYPRVGSMILLFLFVFLQIQCCACAFHAVGMATLDSTGGGNWLANDNLMGIDWKLRYFCSFYFALTTMMNVIYGDIHATNNPERACSMAISLCSYATFTYVVAEIGLLIQEMLLSSVELNKTRQHIMQFMMRRQMSTDTQVKMMHYLEYVKPEPDHEQSLEILQSLPKQLRKPLFSDRFEVILKENYAFSALFSKKCVKKIAELMTEREIRKNTVLIKESEICETIFFLVDGAIEITFPNRNSMPVNLSTEGKEIVLRESLLAEKLTYSIKATQQTAVACLKINDLWKATGNSGRDYEALCSWRDGLLLGESTFGMNCVLCEQNGHDMIDCPFLKMNISRQRVSGLSTREFSAQRRQIERRKEVTWDPRNRMEEIRRRLKQFRLFLMRAAQEGAPDEKDEELLMLNDEEFFAQVPGIKVVSCSIDSLLPTEETPRIESRLRRTKFQAKESSSSEEEEDDEEEEEIKQNNNEINLFQQNHQLNDTNNDRQFQATGYGNIPGSQQQQQPLTQQPLQQQSQQQQQLLQNGSKPENTVQLRDIQKYLFGMFPQMLAIMNGEVIENSNVNSNNISKISAGVASKPEEKQQPQKWARLSFNPFDEDEEDTVSAAVNAALAPKETDLLNLYDHKSESSVFEKHCESARRHYSVTQKKTGVSKFQSRKPGVFYNPGKQSSGQWVLTHKKRTDKLSNNVLFNKKLTREQQKQRKFRAIRALLESDKSQQKSDMMESTIFQIPNLMNENNQLCRQCESTCEKDVGEQSPLERSKGIIDQDVLRDYIRYHPSFNVGQVLKRYIASTRNRLFPMIASTPQQSNQILRQTFLIKSQSSHQ